MFFLLGSNVCGLDILITFSFFANQILSGTNELWPLIFLHKLSVSRTFVHIVSCRGTMNYGPLIIENILNYQCMDPIQTKVIAPELLKIFSIMLLRLGKSVFILVNQLYQTTTQLTLNCLRCCIVHVVFYVVFHFTMNIFLSFDLVTPFPSENECIYMAASCSVMQCSNYTLT